MLRKIGRVNYAEFDKLCMRYEAKLIRQIVKPYIADSCIDLTLSCGVSWFSHYPASHIILLLTSH